jgi:hypothetical protein
MILNYLKFTYLIPVLQMTQQYACRFIFERFPKAFLQMEILNHSDNIALIFFKFLLLVLSKQFFFHLNIIFSLIFTKNT